MGNCNHGPRFIITGSIARSASRRYLVYSEADFEVFLPAGATCCTDGGEPSPTKLGMVIEHDKFGGVRISPAAGVAKNLEFFLSICLSVCSSHF